MLSNSAFNALLKVLEEPAPYVKFILATTEGKKIPVTIISRCQRFDLQRISTDNIVNHLKLIAKEENISFDEESIKLIAYNSDGSMRNALSLLEQSAIYSNKNLSEESTKKMLGHVNRHTLLKIIESIVNGNAVDALNKFEEVCCSYSPVIVLDNILQTIYEICYFSITKKNNFSHDIDIITRIQNNRIQSPIFLSRLWQILFKGLQEVKLSVCVNQAANMLIVRLCYLSDLPSPKQIIEKLQSNVKANDNGLDINRKMLLALLKTNNMNDLCNQLSESNLEITYNNDGTPNIVLTTMLSNNSQKELLNFLNNLTSKKWNISIKKNNNQCYNLQLDSTISDILQEFDGAKVINIETIKKEQ